MVSRIVLAWLVATLCLPGWRAGGASGQGSAPADTLADGRVGQIHFESRTPAGYFALARHATSPTVVTYSDSYHDFNADRAPRVERALVTGRACDMVVDLDHFTVTRRGTGEDITAAGLRRTSRPSRAACYGPTRIDGLRAVCYGCRANRFSHSSRTMWSGRWQ